MAPKITIPGQFLSFFKKNSGQLASSLKQRLNHHFHPTRVINIADQTISHISNVSFAIQREPIDNHGALLFSQKPGTHYHQK